MKKDKKMENSEILDVFNKEVRRECEWTRMRRESFPHLVRYTLTDVGNGGGMISWSDLTAETADETIKTQIAYFKELNTDFEWKYYSYDQPSDLPQRLLAHGFTADEPEALMIADINDLPSEFWTMDVSAVLSVTKPEEVDEIVRMESEVWEDDISGFAKGMKYDLENNPNHISVFAVWKNGRIVSAAWTHYLLSTSFATLWGGSTLKEYRKHGFYTSLLAVRAREARQRGFRFLQVDASPNSQPILAKYGFRCLAYSTPYDWTPK
jgi:GNAT superfamily N-acetyltransferase